MKEHKRAFAHEKVLKGHEFGEKTKPEKHNPGDLSGACDWLQEYEGQREPPARSKELEGKGELREAEGMVKKLQGGRPGAKNED